MKAIFSLLAIVAVMLFVVGCKSTSTITEIDPATGKVTKITETSETIVDQVVKSTQNKTCYVWTKGWFARVYGSPGTTESPTPTVDMEAGNLDKGVLTIHKDQKDMKYLSDIIRACNSSSLNISKDGISGNGGNAAVTK